ncbi:MAG: gliding motility-associated lipoprotein GldH [Flavobacteriaceae bacterium]|jgi:gliding motility-associated lipoprotein GldH|uniref:gliding motility lipoprotein GldH n=1 Tax=Candidatus Marifrigoribacter sp. Uisw_064 TaxID=3230970 RepID=UPI003AE2787B
MLNRVIYFLSLMLLISCTTNTLVSDSKSLENTWNKNDIIKFEIPQLDSLQLYNVFINIRNTNDYKYSNLFIIASIEFPHGKSIVDTLEYKMAQADGTWLGTGIGSVKENKLWYKENVSFTEEGTYTLRIEQAVRNNGDVEGVFNLEGITDVGYSIERPSQQ